MSNSQIISEALRHDGLLGVMRGAVVAAARAARDLNLKRRSATAALLRCLPGSSACFGPPRRLVPALHDRLPRAENPEQLLGAPDDAWTPVHAPETMNFRPPRTLPGMPDPFSTLPLTHTQPEALLFALHDARVAGSDGTIITQRDEIFGEGSAWGLEELKQRPLPSALWPGKVAFLRGPHLHATGRWHSNYFHWLFDICSRLLPLRGHPDFKKIPLLIPAQTRPIQSEILRMLGFDGPLVPQPAPLTRVEKLLYASPVRDSFCPPLWALREIRAAAGLVSNRPASRRIYISRNDAKYRRVANEAEIVALLEQHGFESIQLTGKSFREQIEIFNGSSHVIGANGSSFTNLVFGEPGTKVLELFALQYTHGAPFSLADALGMEYWYLVGTSAGLFDLRVSPDQVRSVLENWGLQ